MPDYSDPNLGSQAEGARRQDEIDYQYASFAQLVAQDPEVQQFVQAHGGRLDQAQTAQLIQLVKQKFPNNGPAGWTLNANGQVTAAENKIPTFVKVLAIEMGASLAIPAITALASAGGASAGTGLAGGAMTPAGVAIAPSVDIGADALAGGLTAGIADVGTYAGGLGSTGAADAGTTAAVGSGAGSAAEGTAIADVGTPGFVGNAVADTAATANPVAALSTPAVANISAPALATTPGVTAAAAAPSVGAGAAAAAPSLWDKVGKVFSNPAVTTGIGAATTLIGAKMGADASRDASQAQLQAAREALDWEKSVYGQRQQQLAPTINIGNSAREQLATMMGIQPNTPSNGWNYVTPQNAPNAVANPKWTTQSPTAPAGMVSMVSPDGKSGFIPQKNVQAALNAGGRLA